MNVECEGSDRIRVLVADDSATMRSTLSRMLEASPRIQVCGTARDGVETVEKNKLLMPDVITLDVDMPVLDGIAALRRIMKDSPCPVIMVSSLTREGAQVTLEALDAGAFDYLSKEDLRREAQAISLPERLTEKVEVAARSRLARNRRLSKSASSAKTNTDSFSVVPKIVVLGTSTGGPKALQEVLTVLPADLPIGVVAVQHMPPGFTGPFAKRLDSLCRLRIHEAQPGEIIEPGNVYLAPAGQHTRLFSISGSRVSVLLSDMPTDTLHKPSVDVTMLSAVEVYKNRILGIILTGMGSDGLQGMTAIHKAGGITIGQDEASCTVYGMPRCCAESGVLQRVVPLSDIPQQILQAVRYRARG